MGKYRGLNITGGLNANFRKIKVRKTVDTESLQDRGTIAEAASDLPTKGAGHRRGRGALKSQRKAATGATRGSISMGWITGDDSNVIDEHDYGYIFQNTEANDRAAWETRRALGVAASIAEGSSATAAAPVYATGVSLYNSTAIIPAGTPLILNTDGTVSAVQTVPGSNEAGALATYGTGDFLYPAVVYDSANSKAVFFYHKGSDKNGYARVVSIAEDGTLTYGPETLMESGNGSYGPIEISATMAGNSIVVAWRGLHISNRCRVIAGTISGTSISFGQPQTVYTTGVNGTQASSPNVVWDPVNNKGMLTYAATNIEAAFFTISGNSVSVGSPTILLSPDYAVSVYGINSIYHSESGHFALWWNGSGATYNTSYASRGYTVDTTQGTPSIVSQSDSGISSSSNKNALSYDTSNGKVVLIGYQSKNYVVASIDSNGTITYGTPGSLPGITDNSNVSGISQADSIYDPTTNLHVADVRYNDGSTQTKKYLVGTLSGDTVSWDVTDSSTPDDTWYRAMAYDTTNNKIVIHYSVSDNVKSGGGYVLGAGAASSNLTGSNFIGFAKDGFTSAGQLGKVISFGGTVDAFTGLTVGETYYVQNDGSISLTTSDVVAGPAVSTTAIQVQAPVVNYSYEGSTYTLGAKSGTFSSGPYSSAITLDGNTVFQGFPYEMSPNEESGGLEIYTKDSGGNWSVLQTIAPPLEGAANSFKWRFGATVRVTDDGNRMVTMRTGGVSGYSPGKFYVYDKNETSGLYELTASHQHYSDASMSNQRFDKSTGYNGLDMSPDGTLIMIHHMKYVNSSSGYENWAIVYRLDENGTYQYTDKIQMPISGSQGSMSGASQWSPTDMSTSGHFIMGHPTWNSFGKAAYAYYDLETGQTYSGLLAPNSGTVNAFGKGVAMAGDGSVCAVLDPTWQYQYAQGVEGAIFIYTWDSNTKTYSFSQQLAANDNNPSDVLRQAQNILFNSDGSQLFVKRNNSMLIYEKDENGTFVLSEELANSFVTNGWGVFSSSSDMAWLLCGGGTFGVHGGTSGSAGQSSGNLPTANSSTWYGDRMIASGGRTSSKYSSIEYIEIATGGNATAMGNMLEAKVFNSSISDSSNYYTIGGQTDAFGHSKLIEYKAFSSTANSSQYGDLTGFFAMGAAGSNGVTGIYAHQYGLLGSYLTGMDWFTLGGTSGNSSSLGDLSVGRSTGAGCADATYFVLGGGNYDGGPYAINTTEYLTIATGGTATAGGNLSYGAQANGAASNATKGIWAGGYSNASSSTVNSMSVMTLANPSNNATNFGNLTVAVQYPGLSCSSDKVIQAGGYGNNYVNTISSASIETGGTTSSIGTLSVARMGVGAATGNAS